MPFIYIAERSQDAIFLSVDIRDTFGVEHRISNFLVGAVPEPATAALVTVALAAISAFRRRR